MGLLAVAPLLVSTIGKRLDPLGSDALDWDRLAGAAGVYVTAGDAVALKLARQAPVLVASPRARTALDEPDGPAIDAIVFSARDRDEQAWADRSSAQARLLVATEGPAGGRWWGTSEGRWQAIPPPGPVVDSYGCGDSFAAGLTYGLAGGLSVEEAAAVGARCGAVCATRAGAP